MDVKEGNIGNNFSSVKMVNGWNRATFFFFRVFMWKKSLIPSVSYGYISSVPEMLFVVLIRGEETGEGKMRNRGRTEQNGTEIAEVTMAIVSALIGTEWWGF